MPSIHTVGPGEVTRIIRDPLLDLPACQTHFATKVRANSKSFLNLAACSFTKSCLVTATTKYPVRPSRIIIGVVTDKYSELVSNEKKDEGEDKGAL